MADRIKGIVVEIGGDTVGLQNALKDVNEKSRNLQGELKDVQRLLKFDPNNAELLAQKQRLLNEQVDSTTEKLQRLKNAESQVQAQFEKGEIKEEQYRAFKRELTETEQALKGAQTALKNMANEQNEVQKSQQQLNRLLEVSKSNLSDYEDLLGSRLVRSIQQGTATSKDLRKAFEKIGTEATGSKDNIKDLKIAIDRLDAGEKTIKSVRKEFQKMSDDAKNAKDSAKDLGGELAGMAAGAAAGVGIGGIFEKAMDVSSFETQIDISFNVPEESKSSIKEAVKGVKSYGVDVQEALEGARRQWALNADQSDETNAKIVNMAGAIVRSIEGIDFTELIQETNEIATELKMSQEEALAMTNTLLDMGFPPEQLDIISEYGSQLSRAGYSATEIQGIFAAGIKTGTWNIDILLDGLKEGRIRLAEMGTGVDEATQKMLSGTSISASQVQSWGQSLAEGGENGKKAMMDVALALSGIEDDTKRNQLGIQFFGSLWEEQGSKITDTIINAKDNMGDLAANQDQMNAKVKELDSDPQVRLNNAIEDMTTALTPVLTDVAEFVGKIADWISKNPELAATLTAIGTVLGILIGIMLAISPIILSIISLMGTMSLSFAAIAAPILIAIAVIAAIIAIGILLWKNWDTIKEKAGELAAKIGEKFNQFKETIKQKLSEAWEKIKEIWGKVTGFFEGIDLKKIGVQIIQGLIDGIGSMGKEVWKKAKEIAGGIGKSIREKLEVSSPSKLTFRLGRFTGEGLAAGLKDSMSQIKAMSQDMASAAVPDIKSQSSMLQPTGAANKSLTVNLHSPKALDVREANREFNRTLNKMSLMW